MVILLGRKTIILLHHNVITLAEGIVHTAFLGIEIYPATLSIVVIHLHHGGKDAVVVLAQQLGYNHLEDAHGSSHDEVVKL